KPLFLPPFIYSFFSTAASTFFTYNQTMGFREVLLFLSITILATSSAAMDQQTYIIHMDTTKMATNNNPEQWYTTMIDSLTELSSLDDDNNEEVSNPAEILYIYKTAIS
ncbi:unnamed protein product, partial [Citrullus colocynthis]